MTVPICKHIHKICNECKETKDMLYFTVSGVYKGNLMYQGRCKPCRSDILGQRLTIKKAKQNPQDYIECDDCDKVSFKWTSVKYKVITRKKCPRCDSEEINDFFYEEENYSGKNTY